MLIQFLMAFLNQNLKLFQLNNDLDLKRVLRLLFFTSLPEQYIKLKQGNSVRIYLHFNKQCADEITSLLGNA